MSNEAFVLEFAGNDSKEDEGLGHAGIETYRQQPYASAARELGQNSRDAYSSLPVKIKFDLIEIPKKNIPAIVKLDKVVALCLDASLAEKKEKEKAFFSEAKKILALEHIKVLRVSDENTTGAKGAQRGSPFYSLLRAAGVSVKPEENSGGSYGIGKNAAFAISDLRTVFYSTVFLDDETGSKRFLTQGKSILISHVDEGLPKRQIGYWGGADFEPVSDPVLAPEWLRRESIGTSVFVVGFRDPAEWQSHFTRSLIQNFFPAVHDDEMEFSIDGGNSEINRDTLGPLFDAEVVRKGLSNERDQGFSVSFDFYRCYSSAKTKSNVFTIPELGRVQVKVLVGDKLPKKICIIRNGMVITDNLSSFNEPFLRFPMYKDFVAVVTFLDVRGSSFIKRLEDPKHKELSADGLLNQDDRDVAKRVMKKLAGKIRAAIKEHTFTEYENEVLADEMRDYFPAGSAPELEQRNSDNDDPETIKYQIEPRKKRPSTEAYTDVEGDAEAGGGFGDGRGGKVGEGRIKYPGDVERARSKQSIPLLDVRNIITTGGASNSRTVFFTPTISTHALLSIDAVGINKNEPLTVSSAFGANVKNGAVLVEFLAGKRIKIDLEFSEMYRGPIEIRAAVDVLEVSSNEN
ncbi:hypothetical protein SAMN05216496_1737 [Pseudomonas sp. Z003-0.4C(8344-21)]|uniref:hypothetical protein n=1 Tax=Pseudomonas sp. Z003-0.4C(8344-21) TaxID=1855380 RepID=UPI00087BBE07|nr:hypothetical protein [Pseudomonas sp. Z003-0.4C(8344-21)]SDS50532.1 hypothetical protein SAMN05216496_1737 [Pseudomonas sp. Z003-0.4C(8344-21)]